MWFYFQDTGLDFDLTVTDYYKPPGQVSPTPIVTRTAPPKSGQDTRTAHQKSGPDTRAKRDTKLPLSSYTTDASSDKQVTSQNHSDKKTQLSPKEGSLYIYPKNICNVQCEIVGD